MNWKTRQMFSDQEHGLVSGLSPINMVNGGSVPMPGYEDGGTVGQALREGFTEPMQNIAQTLGAGMGTGAGGALREGFTEPMQNIAQTLGAGVAGATAGSLLGPALFEGAEEPSIEQRVAELATKMGISPVEARAMILTQMLEQQGVTLPEEVINQFATGLITLHEALAQAQAVGGGGMAGAITGSLLGPALEGVTEAIQGMQDGGVALDLFEEGDEDINQALNMMSGSVNPPLSDIGPTAPTEIEEAIDEETAIMDQGLTPESKSFENALNMLKESFKEEIRNYVVQVMEPQKVKEYLDNMNMTYANALNKLKSKHGVEAYSPNEELLDPLFMEEISQLMAGGTQELPGYDDGGIVISQTDLNNLGINLTLDEWNTILNDDQRKLLINQAIARKAGSASTTGPDTSKLDDLLARREGIAGDIGKAARSSYSSSLPRILHYGAAKSAGELAEAEAMDKTLADQISAERGILSAYGRGGSSLGSTADFMNAFTGVGGREVDTLALFKILVGEHGTAMAEDPQSRALIDLAEQGARPPNVLTIYNEPIMIGDTPVTWTQFYRLRKQQLLEENPDVQVGTEEFYVLMIPIIGEWTAAASAQ
jgi:hypothetical protein